MHKFRGVSNLSLDAKGRIVLPARYRERLVESCQGQLVVTIDTDQPCLLIYPLPEWELIEEKIEALPSFNPTTRRIQRLLIGHATEAEVDANGRMLLSNPLRDYARLGKKVVLIGQGKKFELWDESLWNERMEAWLADSGGDEMPGALAELTL
ncbi:MAG: division/cell wall cluster transcriptional repressor MraZ [Gammaproteobacteria bacterium]|nr:division/cell wall cluster transcriptional repressor MraZ [Gammaproteobacteria bacterium]MDH3537701.1 division/cell wall cluster transcriptional repressor MraZ [Gammaproteobacteria bacterium]